VKLFKFFWIIKNMIKPIWLMVNGRWYVYKDSSTLLVRFIAQMDYQEGKDTYANNLIRLAREEMQTRKMRKK